LGPILINFFCPPRPGGKGFCFTFFGVPNGGGGGNFNLGPKNLGFIKKKRGGGFEECRGAQIRDREGGLFGGGKVFSIIFLGGGGPQKKNSRPGKRGPFGPGRGAGGNFQGLFSFLAGFGETRGGGDFGGVLKREPGGGRGPGEGEPKKNHWGIKKFFWLGGPFWGGLEKGNFSRGRGGRAGGQKSANLFFFWGGPPTKGPPWGFFPQNAPKKKRTGGGQKGKGFG